MDSDWEEISRIVLPPPGGAHNLPTPIASLSFDTQQELLWIGNDDGRVSGFSGVEMQRYTSFKVGLGTVHQILIHDTGVISLAPGSVHMAMRRGPPLWHIELEDMRNLRCMSFTSKDNSELLVAGLQDQMFLIDVGKGTVKKQIPTSNHYEIMKRSRHICAASPNGVVNILDSATFKVLKTWNAHSALINDMDAQHDYIVTCGYSVRPGGAYMYDSYVNVFNLKTLTTLSPVPFPAGATCVRMHPRMSTTAIVVSHMGQMHVVDLMNVNTSNVRHANILTSLTKLEIAPSGQAIAIADAECQVQLYGSRLSAFFTSLNNPIEQEDMIEAAPQMDWSVETPLNTIGLQFYREQLLSAWPGPMISDVGAPPSKIVHQLSPSWKTTEWGSYAPNTSGVKRNQAINTRASDPPKPKAPPFLHENKANEGGIGDLADGIDAAKISSLKEDLFKERYSNVEIKYSKYGVDDFDFRYYNPTSYSGLETHISNSYANSLLQLMHSTPLIRNLALAHVAKVDCKSDMCLLCEMGFLFDMLEKAEGSICQATNFLKTFSNYPQAGHLGLLEENTHSSSLTAMLQGLARFLLERVAQEHTRVVPHASNLVNHILSMTYNTTIRCMNCGSEHTRPGATPANELIYPPPILNASIVNQQTSRGWCSRCQRYQTLASGKVIRTVPAVFMINAAINTAEAKQLWSTPGWLPEEIGIMVEAGQFFCFEGEDLKHRVQKNTQDIVVYSLIGLAVDIHGGHHQKSHLVSLVNMAHSRTEAPAERQWHVLNDFLVLPITAEDALTFDTTWKLPSVIAYQAKEANNRIDLTWKEQLDSSLLYEDPNPRAEMTYQTLTREEAPGVGTEIALDTEFVAIRQEEFEMNSDGKRNVIRPMVYALARVSVIRASGENEGVPFIDDYIVSKEPIADYLTKYSGIVPGDLDPQISRHNPVSLKVAYKKLWILLNLGCKFVGHGLRMDFRVTNIQVPKAQIVDTADMFYIRSSKRKVGLAFLAWYLLKKDIQILTHDSIEDAKMALKLYRKYEEFKRSGILDIMVDNIYREGAERNFKPPAHKQDGEVIQRTETPPIVDGRVIGGSGVPAGPTTPVRRPAGLTAPGTGGSFGFTPGKGSPLR